MIASNLPESIASHLLTLCGLAMQLAAAASEFKSPLGRVRIKVGVNAGPVVAGVRLSVSSIILALCPVHSTPRSVCAVLAGD